MHTHARSSSCNRIRHSALTYWMWFKRFQCHVNISCSDYFDLIRLRRDVWAECVFVWTASVCDCVCADRRCVCVMFIIGITNNYILIWTKCIYPQQQSCDDSLHQVRNFHILQALLTFRCHIVCHSSQFTAYWLSSAKIAQIQWYKWNHPRICSARANMVFESMCPSRRRRIMCNSWKLYMRAVY